jgi:short subunit dehydrogenase-like uncharacterized protein
MLDTRLEDMRWMIYGATGYTGTLVAEEALRRGHRPLLAGRSEEKLRKLGRRLGLKYVAFDLDDVNVIARHTATVDLVYHAAGPFAFTSDPMIRACLATHTHYVDITGEVPVLERSASYDDVALRNGVAIISGAGFDVIPSDCLAAYVAARVPRATTLEIAFQALTSITAGTALSMLEMLPQGGLVRRSGTLQRLRLGAGIRTIDMPNGRQRAMPIPWGDLATAYRSTHIPNITTYMVVPPALAAIAPVAGPAGTSLLGFRPARQAAGSIASRIFSGPGAAQRTSQRSYLWARAADNLGISAEAWLICAEGYEFTAQAAVPVVERVLQEKPAGALTPSQAFGPDFVLEIAGSQRWDELAYARAAGL